MFYHKTIKELKEELNKIYNSGAYEYYVDEYDKKYKEAFNIAKEEILTYKPLSAQCFMSRAITMWKNTKRIKHDYLSYVKYDWSCNNIHFNRNDANILECLYSNRIEKNLKTYQEEEPVLTIGEQNGCTTWLHFDTSICDSAKCKNTKKKSTTKKKPAKKSK